MPAGGPPFRQMKIRVGAFGVTSPNDGGFFTSAIPAGTPSVTLQIEIEKTIKCTLGMACRLYGMPLPIASGLLCLDQLGLRPSDVSLDGLALVSNDSPFAILWPERR